MFNFYFFDATKAADMQVIQGPESIHSYSLVNQTSLHSGNATARRRVKKVRKTGYKANEVEEEGDDDDSYEEIITKTKIVVHKKRKSKKAKGKYSGAAEEEYDEYEDGDSEFANELQAIGVESLYLSSDLTVTHRVPKPATCTTWNGNKMKTFDGLVFNANMRCSHTLVKDRADGTFGIVLRACANSQAEPCFHSIEIMMSNTKYIVENLSKCSSIVCIALLAHNECTRCIVGRQNVTRLSPLTPGVALYLAFTDADLIVR